MGCSPTNRDTCTEDLTVPGGRPTLPDVIRTEVQGEERVLHLYVADNLAWFDGHFPGDPILPAVVQIDWAIHFGAACGLDPDRFSGMKRLKFHAVIVPDTELQLTLRVTPDTLKFVFTSDGGLHSKGEIQFHGSGDRG